MNLIGILEREGFIPSDMLVTTNMETFYEGYRVAAAFNGLDLDLMITSKDWTYCVHLVELDADFSQAPPVQSADELFDYRFRRMRNQTSQLKNAIAWAKSLIDEAIAAEAAA